MYYFKSNYNECSYSNNWYGTLDYAPTANVMMYDDVNCFCVGTMNEKINVDSVEYISEDDALRLIEEANGDDENIWKGDKLLHRWDVVEYGE